MRGLIVILATLCVGCLPDIPKLPDAGKTFSDGGFDAGPLPADTNCTTPGPSPDEDCDGVADEADNCPAEPNADQADVDADEIGDACDPQPDIGDELLLFDGFAEGLSPPWSILRGDGAWSASAGRLRGVAPGITALVERAATLSNRLRVEVRFWYRVISAAEYQSAMVTLQRPDGDLLACGVIYQENSVFDSGVQIYSLDGDGEPSALEVSEEISPPEARVPYELVAILDGADLSCGREGLEPPAVFSGAPFTPSAVGLRVKDADVEFDSVVVYALGS